MLNSSRQLFGYTKDDLAVETLTLDTLCCPFDFFISRLQERTAHCIIFVRLAVLRWGCIGKWRSKHLPVSATSFTYFQGLLSRPVTLVGVLRLSVRNNHQVSLIPLVLHEYPNEYF